MSNSKNQWITVVEQNLITAEWCVETSNHGGGILGYSAALLLLCTADAIGHGLLPPIKGKHTRLDVLMQPPFDPNPNLDDKKVCKLTSWYRNMLAHTGTLSPNVFLEPDVQGAPFGFDDNDEPNLIRIPVLYKVIKVAWERRDTNVFFPPKMSGSPPPKPPVPPYGFAASGFVSLPGS